MRIDYIFCRLCHELKPKYHFTDKYLPHQICWPCQKTTPRPLTTLKKKERARERAFKQGVESPPKHFRKFELQYFIFLYLLEHPCVRCGERNPLVLEFDHRDPKQKRAEIGELIKYRVTTERILEEIALCDVLCANCHRIKTAEERQSMRWRMVEFIKNDLRYPAA